MMMEHGISQELLESSSIIGIIVIKKTRNVTTNKYN